MPDRRRRQRRPTFASRRLTEGSRAIGSTRLPAFAALVVCLAGSAALLWPAAGRASAGCGLTDAAFCDTFDQGPAAIRGRGGDLDPAKWSAARLAPSDFSAYGPVVNPVAPAPIPPCKASFPVTSVFPPDDTLICDPGSSSSAQL